MSWAEFLPVMILEQQILLSFTAAGSHVGPDTIGGLENALPQTHTLQLLSTYPESYDCADFASPDTAARGCPAVPLFICHPDYTPSMRLQLKIHQTLAISSVTCLLASLYVQTRLFLSRLFLFLPVSEGEMPSFLQSSLYQRLILLSSSCYKAGAFSINMSSAGMPFFLARDGLWFLSFSGRRQDDCAVLSVYQTSRVENPGLWLHVFPEPLTLNTLPSIPRSCKLPKGNQRRQPGPCPGKCVTFAQPCFPSTICSCWCCSPPSKLFCRKV